MLSSACWQKYGDVLLQEAVLQKMIVRCLYIILAQQIPWHNIY